ncbi:hypothetical protein BT96DRAFT_648691 [Gymnopus androsaceus JB14]|uniref:Uncharacterized protein n=1 Tax=Gymnopus androsaceus JB14 TaxID=1447944 RepID=A0A6A4HQH6_9AGAR|nr:hypothetical protein BT96DRAFT_648691 [Gymnopus androsaceus JB14]
MTLRVFPLSYMSKAIASACEYWSSSGFNVPKLKEWYNGAQVKLIVRRPEEIPSLTIVPPLYPMENLLTSIMAAIKYTLNIPRTFTIKFTSDIISAVMAAGLSAGAVSLDPLDTLSLVLLHFTLFNHVCCLLSCGTDHYSLLINIGWFSYFRS